MSGSNGNGATVTTTAKTTAPAGGNGHAAAPAAKLTRKDFQSSSEVRWCPGCGDYAILSSVQKTLADIGASREGTVFVSGIGCSSRFPYYMNTYGFHTIHGRAPAVATGLKLTRPELQVWIVTGDGDGLSIGGNHLIHVLRRNVDVKILLFNNRIYGLTKGQYSPTSELGKKSKSTPEGSIDAPFNPIQLALGAGATFVARTVDVEAKHLGAVLERMAAHKGAAFLEILQNCPVFNDGAFADVSEKATREDHQLRMESGKPLVYAGGKKGIMLDARGYPQVVTLGEGGVSDKDLLVWDDHGRAGLAFDIAALASPGPTPIGIFRDVGGTSYDQREVDIEARVLQKRGRGDLRKLLTAGDTWTVGS